MDKYLQQNYYRNKVFNLIQVGIWTIELEDGKLPRMYADDVMKRLLGVNNDISPEDCYVYWYIRIFSSQRILLLNTEYLLSFVDPPTKNIMPILKLFILF